MLRLWPLALLASAWAASEASPGAAVLTAVVADDECGSVAEGGGGDCSLSALQLRGVKAAMTTVAPAGVTAAPGIPASSERCDATFRYPYRPRKDNNCYETGHCCDPSMRCFAKTAGSRFAACMPACSEGLHIWEPVEFWARWTCDPVPDSLGAPVSTPAPPPAPDSPSSAPLLTFYVYRAQSNASYPPTNVNAANLGGVIWYLEHEVIEPGFVRWNVSRVLRYKVQTKAPQRLFDAGMNFGVRFAMDSTKCTGPGNCDYQFRHFGYFVGCNYLGDFPYPLFDTHFWGAVWWTFPKEGACAGPPTGAADCTYSYEPAGEATLEEIQAAVEKRGISDGWATTDDVGINEAKAAALQSVFESKYPDSPQLPEPPCDFNFTAFYPDGPV